MSTYLWHNGAWKKDTHAIFQINDRIRLGDGVFDTLLIQNGKPQHLDKHFKRLEENSKALSLKLPMDFKKFETIAAEIIEKNNAHTGRFALNTILSRGLSDRGFKTPENSDKQLVLRLSPLPESFPDLHAIIATKTRRNEGSPLSRIKSFNYGDNILAMIEAEERGCNEAVLLNNQGHVTCTTIANIYCIHEEKITTAPLSDGVLNGIARQLFLKRYGVIEKSISLETLLNADAVFTTNSIRGIQFLKSLNEKEFSPSSLSFDKNFHISS